MHRVGLVLILGFGAAVRCAAFLQNRPLWTDEAFLALNIGSRSYAQLLAPLDYAQVAPVLFLLGVRLVTEIAGVTGQALRFLPLLAGLAFLPALWRLATRFLSAPAALLATALAAVSPAAVYYSNELKPYSLDMLVATVLMLLAHEVIVAPARARSRAALTVGGMVAGWISIASPFVLGAAGLSLLRRPSRSSRGYWLWLAGSGAAWLGSYAAVYLLVYRAAGEQPYMRRFWSESYIDAGSRAGLGRTASLLKDAVLGFFAGGDSLGVGTLATRTAFTAIAALLTALICLGVVHLFRSAGARRTVLIAGPPLLAGAASLLGEYPIATRLFLFAAPSIFIVAAAGCEALAIALPFRRAASLAVAGAAVLALSALPGPGWGIPVIGQSDSRAIVSIYQAEADGEPVYVSARGLPIWTFYITDWSAPDLDRLRFLERVAGPGGPAFQNRDGAGRMVGGEGDALVLQRDGYVEILGLSPGRQWRHATGFTQPEPSPGWAAGEARRIRAAADPYIWLCFLNMGDDSEAELLAEVERQGGSYERRYSTFGAELYRVQFQGPAGVSTPAPPADR